MDGQNISRLLNNLSQQHELIDKAIFNAKEVLIDLIHKDDGSLIYINTLEQEDILYAFNKQSFIFQRFDSMVSFIRTEIGIYHKDRRNSLSVQMPVRIYELDTALNGEVMDDWLIEF